MRLNIEIEECQTELKANAESSQKILEYVISFSELIKNASVYFEHALDSEKREIVNQIFSELYYTNGELKYIAKQGFSALFCRNDEAIAPYGAAQGNRTLIHCLEGSYSTTKLAPHANGCIIAERANISSRPNRSLLLIKE